MYFLPSVRHRRPIVTRAIRRHRFGFTQDELGRAILLLIRVIRAIHGGTLLGRSGVLLKGSSKLVMLWRFKLAKKLRRFISRPRAFKG